MERISFQDAPKGLYDALYQMGNFVEKSGIDKRLSMLVDYYVSQLNGCAYCLDMHFKEALEAGETTVRLSMVSAWRETEVFNELECAVLNYADALTLLSQSDVDNEIYQPMLNHFDKDQIAAWTLAIVKINNWNRFMKAFKIKAGEYQVGLYA